jgi:hypothetical protein
VRRTPLVLGALSIAFGALTAALMLFAVLFGREPAADIGVAQRRYQVASTATFGVMAIALVIIGIGLARRRRWARAGGLAWAIAALGVVEFEFYALGTIAPRTAGMYVMLVVEAIFPLTMLLLLARRSAKDDFISPAPGAARR